MRIFTAVKNVLFGPICPLCNGRKSILFKGKYYCPNCERHILDVKVLEEL